MAEKKMTTRGKIKETVLELLLKYPHLRDSDEKLIATVWQKDLGGRKVVTHMGGVNVLAKIAAGDTTKPASIIRIRAKLQEEYIELRGELYEKRQTELNNRIRDEIRES